MAYNVFKRPMFKRGGSTTGTGIMSHVEPRVKAAMGFPNFGISGQPSQQEIDAFRATNAQRIQDIRNQPGILDLFKGPTIQPGSQSVPYIPGYGFSFMKPGISGGDNTGYLNYLKNRDLKKQMTGKTGVEIGLEGVDGITEYAYDQIEQANQAADAAATKNELQKMNLIQKDDNGDKKPKVNKDEPAYKVSDIESEVKNEAEFLRKLLKDENYSKGELALVIAGALKEPGGITEKLDKARELSLPLARERRKEDKAITLAAYKAAKEKEKYQTRYDKDSPTLQFYKERARTLVGTPEYKGKNENEILKELMSGSAEARINILKSPQTAGEIINVTDRISRLQTELQSTKSERRKKQIPGEILEEKNKIKTLVRMPEFESIFPGVKGSLGFKDGGRVMKAVGGDVTDEDTDMETSDNTVGMAVEKIGEGSGSQTVTEGVQRLSYQELRDRLPQEITDDVVNLLANSEEALQEFAYIRTQDDVNSFNTKYGVNLVIPPTRG